MKKTARQFLIKEIISRQNISSQQELVTELKKRGEIVNQATLSRDLHEIGISRMSASSGSKYVLSVEGEDKRTRTLLSYEIQTIESNESMVVVRTLPGRAQGVAEMIDSLQLPGILATLAGDNTIFVAPRSVQKIKAIEKQLKAFISQEDT
jgi:transcriptional regulator of arginine metabolism